MKNFRLFLVLAMLAFAGVALGQTPSWTPGFWRVDQADHYGVVGNDLAVGDRIFQSSFTFVNNIDLGGQQQLLRTVSYHGTNGFSNSGASDVMQTIITSSGIDSFTVVLPVVMVNGYPQTGQWWDIEAHYRYLVDPDGNGPLNAGDDAFPPIEATPVQAQPHTNLHISYLSAPSGYNCYNLAFTVALDHHYDHSDAHTSFIYTEIIDQMTGVVVLGPYIDDISDPGGNDVVTRSHDAFLVLGPGTYCLRAKLLYSHNWAGHSNYQDVIVDQTDGSNCFEYGGFSTEVEEHVDRHDLSIYPNPATDLVNIEGVDSNHTVTVCDLSGRIVMSTKKETSGILTYDVRNLAPGAYMVRDDANGFGRFEKL